MNDNEKQESAQDLNSAESTLKDQEPTAKNEVSEESKEEINRLTEENIQLFSRLQRLQADFDNFRKRMKAEKQEWRTQTLFDFIRELLPVIDNLERARQAEGSLGSLQDGVDLVCKQLIGVLEKEGLSIIDSLGTEFDPNYHHAIAQVECDEKENTVVEELQKGYLLKERVLRASMVRVAK